jgi:hypothetical protein
MTIVDAAVARVKGTANAIVPYRRRRRLVRESTA